MSAVQAGDRVEIHYTAHFADGSTFFSTRAPENGGAPVGFVAGSGEVIAGISQGVLGMRSGETRVVRVAPEDGFGVRDQQLERRVRLEELPEGVRIGDRLEASSHGVSMPVWVREIDTGWAMLDGNHPLAGHNLIVEIEMIAFCPSQGTF